MGIFSRLLGAGQSAANFMYRDVPLGALKGLGSTVKGVANIGGAVMDKTLGTLSGSTLFEENKKKLAPGMANIDAALKPQGVGQQLGFAGEQIGEFFLPGGVAGRATSLASKALKGAGAVGEATKLASAAPRALSFAQRALAVGKKVATQALSDASTSLQQTGDVKEAGITGAISGALGAATPIVSWLGKKIASQAPRVINSLVKPLSKEFEFGRNAGKGVLNEGVTGLTRESFYNNLVSKKDELGQMIGTALSKESGKVVDVTPAINSIDDFIKKANKSGESALATRLKEIKTAMTSQFDEATGEIIGSKNLKMSPEEARKFKTDIGEAMRWTGEAFNNDMNQARAGVYRGINNLIEDAVPGIKALNARYSDIFSAERAMKRTMDIIERQNLTSLPSTVLASQGLTGLAGAAIRSTLGSTPVKTGIIAPGLQSVGKMVQNVPAFAPGVSGVAGKVGGALAGTNAQPQRTAPAPTTYPKSDALRASQPDKYKQFIDAVIAQGGTEEQAKAFLEKQDLP